MGPLEPRCDPRRADHSTQQASRNRKRGSYHRRARIRTQTPQSWLQSPGNCTQYHANNKDTAPLVINSTPAHIYDAFQAHIFTKQSTAYLGYSSSPRLELPLLSEYEIDTIDVRESDTNTRWLQRAVIALSEAVHRHQDLTLPQPSILQAKSHPSTIIVQASVQTLTLASGTDAVGSTSSGRGHCSPPGTVPTLTPAVHSIPARGGPPILFFLAGPATFAR
jgi:hypothetical protein